MKLRSSFAVLALATTAVLSGCASNDYPTYTSNYPTTNGYYATNFGTVESIQVVRGSSGSSGTAGAVVGGLVGGLIGSQIGGGNGRTAATVAGAAGGALIGSRVERANDQDLFQIVVRMDNGTYQTYTQDSMNDLYVGNRVRIQDGRVSRY